MSSDTSTDTQQIAEAVSREHAMDSLATALDTLLGQGKKYIDENAAKKLRKSWEQISEGAPDDDPKTKKLSTQFETLRDRIHDQVETRNTRYNELEKHLEALGAAIKANDLQTSQQLEQKIINGLNRIRGLSSQRQQTIILALEALQPKIKKLVSWRHWGTVQAREQVIEEIKGLHKSEKDLEKIARRIKQAREEWKQWDNSGEGGDKKLYKAFDDACTAAYEPCRKLFEAQRKQREAASKHRAAVCDTLEQYYEKADWREPDWKAIATLLREQSARWRKLGPAEFRDRKPLQKRYDAIMKRFDGPLDRERKQNLRVRQELIESIVGLTKLDDNRRAINEVQKLKKQWRVTVSGKRKQEQAIWKQFTSACDAVYEKGRESKKAFEAELKENLAAREQLIESIEQVIAGDEWKAATDPAPLSARIKGWRGEWSQLGRAPKADAKKIEDRFRKAIGVASQQLDSLERAAQADRDRNLFARAELCVALEQLAAEAKEPVATTILSSLQDRWDSQPPLDESIGAAMNTRFQSAFAAAESGSSAAFVKSFAPHFETINKLLLQLEIKTEVDSPAAYARERMAQQINRLSAAMGKGKDEPDHDVPTLVTLIHTTGAVKPEQQREIDQRFQTCYQAINS